MCLCRLQWVVVSETSLMLMAGLYFFTLIYLFFLVIPGYFIFVKVFLLAFGFRYYTSLEVASEYFRSGADKVSIGSDAVFAAEEYLCTGVCFLRMSSFN